MFCFLSLSERMNPFFQYYSDNKIIGRVDKGYKIIFYHCTFEYCKGALPLGRLKRLQPPGYSRPAVETDSYSAIIMYPFPMTRLQPVCRPGCPPPDSSRLGSTPLRAVQPASRYDLSAFLNSVVVFPVSICDG